MDKEARKSAILCHKNGEEYFTFSFWLDCPEPKINKQFNMNRKAEEPLESFLSRLRENLLKQMTKKKSKKSKKTQNEDTGSPKEAEIDVEIKFKSGDGVPLELDLSNNAKDFLVQDKLRMEILSVIFDINVNPPLVQAAKLPDAILAGFMLYPFKLDFLFGCKEDSIFSWFISDENRSAKDIDAAKWTKVSEGFFYTVQNDHVDRFVKLEITPKMGDRSGPLFEVVSKNPVSAGPGKCPFEDRQAFTKEKLPKDQFRVVTYNLLADLYADSDFSRTVLHPQCPAYALEINYRKSLFIKELMGYNADIICLQEVDKKIYEGDLYPVFSSLNYNGVFDLKGGQVSEGVACFWNDQKFQLVESSKIVLSEALLNDAKFKDILDVLDTNEKLKESMLNRTTALQTVVLHAKDSDKALVIGTTHLYFKPDADHIRLLQIATVMRELEDIVKRYSEKNAEKQYSTLLCGDFNSSPPFGVLEFMRKKLVDKDYPDWKSAEGEEVLDFKIEHSLNMDSACGTPQYTNYTIGFKDCLDYIFYQTNHLQVTNVIPFPSEEELSLYQAIPNVVFPSDHIACISDLKWKS